jgi:P-type Mg2+ transporter
VQVKAKVLRGEISQEIPHENVVPGDIVLLTAGDSIPGDCLVLESKDLSVNEAALTGETYPADKISGVLAEAAGLSVGEASACQNRTNTLYM